MRLAFATIVVDDCHDAIASSWTPCLQRPLRHRWDLLGSIGRHRSRRPDTAPAGRPLCGTVQPRAGSCNARWSRGEVRT